MGTRLINVRLDETRTRKARRLRAAGVTLSDLVRDAIDARFDALAGPAALRDPVAFVDEVLARHPDPDDAAARTYDVHDRFAARAAIRTRLKRGAG